MEFISQSQKSLFDEKVRVLLDTYDEVKMLCGPGSYDGLTLRAIAESMFKLKILTDLCEQTVAQFGVYDGTIKTCDFVIELYSKALPRDKKNKKKMEKMIEAITGAIDTVIDAAFVKMFTDPDGFKKNAKTDSRWSSAVGVDTSKIAGSKYVSMPEALAAAGRFKELLNACVHIDLIPRHF